MEKLKAIGDDPSSSNPVLNKLGQVLKQAFQTTPEIPEKRGILFTRTRDSVGALITWVNETEDLKFLRPGRLIGSGRVGGEGLTTVISTHRQVLKKTLNFFFFFF